MSVNFLFLSLLFPSVETLVYLFSTADSPSTQFYDCINQEGLFYCRRPMQQIVLNRSDIRCHHRGTRYSFARIRSLQIDINTILHQWKSSIEKIEQYSRFLSSSGSDADDYLCNCSEPHVFGKHCEYLLPRNITFDQTLKSTRALQRFNPRYEQVHGGIVCYRVLECNSGLLCLDWREICNGTQQCMSGLDEDNCDQLEFADCEREEYRCMNGMCIPEEYFLDGDFDCLDWSDEIQYYDDTSCPIDSVSIQCDDRLCPPNQ